MLKTIGTDARKSIERFLGTHVYLSLRVQGGAEVERVRAGPEEAGLRVMKPLVAIVGRPNVGKSTLFNRLAGRRLALVEDVPGRHPGPALRGRGVGRPAVHAHRHGRLRPGEKDKLLTQVREQAQLAVEECDVILFVVDGRAGLTAADEEVAELLRKSGKPLLARGATSWTPTELAAGAGRRSSSGWA